MLGRRRSGRNVRRVYSHDGRLFASDVTEARGDPEDPLDRAAVEAKFDRLAAPVLGADAARALRGSVAALADGVEADAVIAAMARPPG